MEMTNYAAGTPSWVDLSATDIKGACDFYGSLFGWTFEDQGAEFDHYTVASLNGKSVAGISAARTSTPTAVWATFITVDDAETAVKAVVNAGGQQLGEIMEIAPAGRMAVFKDVNGAEFCTWQPNEMIGASLVNEPGALAWNELYASDTQKAKAFYDTVFGWQPVSRDFNGMEYTTYLLDDRGIAGMVPLDGNAPEGMPSFWLPYFAVTNADESIEAIKQLGGEIKMGPMDIEIGRFAVTQDAQGASFAIIQLAK
jgi:predicted enzyme related to lactoylglutathione lyase